MREGNPSGRYQEDQLTPCIETQVCKTNDGYGRQRYEGKNQLSHRIAYIEHHGLTFEDIKGLVVRHKCDNPPCINPEHLELGTQCDNIMDMIKRGRDRKTPQPGEMNAMHKLSDSQVSEIRSKYTGGYGQQAELSREYGVSTALICLLVNNKLRVS